MEPNPIVRSGAVYVCCAGPFTGESMPETFSAIYANPGGIGYIGGTSPLFPMTLTEAPFPVVPPTTAWATTRTAVVCVELAMAEHPAAVNTEDAVPLLAKSWCPYPKNTISVTLLLEISAWSKVPADMEGLPSVGTVEAQYTEKKKLAYDPAEVARLGDGSDVVLWVHEAFIAEKVREGVDPAPASSTI